MAKKSKTHSFYKFNLLFSHPVHCILKSLDVSSVFFFFSFLIKLLSNTFEVLETLARFPSFVISFLFFKAPIVVVPGL